MTPGKILVFACVAGGFGAGLAAEGFGAPFIACAGISLFAAAFLFAHFRTGG